MVVVFEVLTVPGKVKIKIGLLNDHKKECN